VGSVISSAGSWSSLTLAYENTWEKLDRQFLSGDEPTLPSNVAYEGRFNDVSVYSGTLSDYRPK